MTAVYMPSMCVDEVANDVMNFAFFDFMAALVEKLLEKLQSGSGNSSVTPQQKLPGNFSIFFNCGSSNTLQ